MPRPLIIVESPAKTRTLKNFLGGEYDIEASMGHVRDLPERALAVDIEHGFTPTYETIAARRAVLRKLADAARRAPVVYLASDPDREGEAIAWHLVEALKLRNARRIQFNEITQNAVVEALRHPREVDSRRVDAQQARRVLDRLVGYKLSPLLWSKIQKGLSAGRVQSVAVRLICEREREISAFVPEEYWSLTATLTPRPPAERFPFAAKLHSRAGERLQPKSEAEVSAIVRELDAASYTVSALNRKEQRRNPAAPFITSTLQQEAARKLGFSNKRTMTVAQHLYEGIDLGEQGSVGLITYMRTDSVRVAAEAVTEARRLISERYGDAYVPEAARQFKSRKAAQDAHEAVRPTSVFREPEAIATYLSPDQVKLYSLIWKRFVASQMRPALLEVTTVDVAATGPANPGAPYVFRATGTVVKYDGFMRVYTEGRDTQDALDEDQPPLPPLDVGQDLDLLELAPRQHFTEPPPRYTEASIVKALEELGIGRPSTYAAIISTIREREYVDLKEKRFHATDLGLAVNDQLVKCFAREMDVRFTAQMETRLDEVEEGRADWVELLRGFWEPFSRELEAARECMENLKPPPVETDVRCPATGHVMLLRQGRYGAFLGCSAFPKCRKTLRLDADGNPVEGLDFVCGLEERSGRVSRPGSQPERNGAGRAQQDGSEPAAGEYVCPDDRGGRMVQRQSRYGPFLGCTKYPACRTTLKIGADGAVLPDQEFNCTYSASRDGGRTERKSRGRARRRKAAAR